MENREKKNFSFGRQEKKSNSIKISSISDVTDKDLIDYLHSRAIPFMPDWLKQVDYTVIKDNKTYLNSAVGIKNSAGGYAVRNQKIKMNIGKSAYSLFAKDSKKELVFVAEGMFDGLSIAEKMKNNRLYDLIILNSTNNLNSEVIKILSGYKNIILVLDNDVSGKEAQNEISRQVKNVNIHKLTFKAKDLNEAFVLKEKIGVAVCR
jgi:5S rRNA maturation endonuclease (ribonuclease M5)